MSNDPIPGRLAGRARALGRACIGLVAASLLVSVAQATSVRSQNLVDLIQHSERIIVGTVESVRDGFDANNVPYTEVTLRVSESIRGGKGETYTFRQFGLTGPRQVDGRTYLGVTPEGWPTWNERERVMVFMNPPARLTGLQTTVGLSQGKFHMRDGQLMNASQNLGIFKNMKVESRQLTKGQADMLRTDGAAVDASQFIGLVRAAVQQDWVGRGVLRNDQ